ncbi:MAG: YigZ family protein [Bacteroidota bacterium]
MPDIQYKYKTISAQSSGVFRDRNSRFIAHAIPVNSEDDVRHELELLRKKYYDAKHHCYAYILGPDKMRYRYNDDGEPSNSAGVHILGQIKSFDLTNVLIVVIRYFGGTKLGIPGLINAYRTASKLALENADSLEKMVCTYIELLFSYPAMNDVMKVLKDAHAGIELQEFELSCRMIITIPVSDVTTFLTRTGSIEHFKYNIIKTE